MTQEIEKAQGYTVYTLALDLGASSAVSRAISVAVAEPRLGAAWFVPLAMSVSTATHNRTTRQTAVTVAAGALTVALAVWPDRARAPLAPAQAAGSLEVGR